MPAGSDHRQRVRAATLSEIKETARALLVRDGSNAVTLRAIGREIGMTAPALYRYYPNLEQLLTAVSTDLYDELTAYLTAARDRCPPDDPTTRMLEVCREFRRWSIAHRAEFGLMFGDPPLDITSMKVTDCQAEAHAAGLRLAAVFGDLFAQWWRMAHFPVPPDEGMSPALREQLGGYRDDLGSDMPLGAVQAFLSAWIRLYGMVAMEVFGHLHFAFSDAEPMFEAELLDIARRMGLPPA